MSKGLVLVADDDGAIRTVLNQALSRAGYEVRVTSNVATLVALDSGRRRRSGDHRRDHAGRRCIRTAAAHQAHPSGTAGRRHERAKHVHDRDQGIRARRIRISAQALRPAGTDRNCGQGGFGAETPEAEQAKFEDGADRHAAGRPLAGHAGNLPRSGPVDADRPDADDHRRIRDRQGTGCARAA